MQVMKIEFSVFRDTKYDMCLYHVFHHHEHISKRERRKKNRNEMQISLKIIIMKQSKSIDYQNLLKHLFHDKQKFYDKKRFYEKRKL